MNNPILNRNYGLKPVAYHSNDYQLDLLVDVGFFNGHSNEVCFLRVHSGGKCGRFQTNLPTVARRLNFKITYENKLREIQERLIENADT
jgi:hypothetical protein